jgi:hypothetical protein
VKMGGYFRGVKCNFPGKKRKQRSGVGKKGKKIYWEMFSGSSCSSLGFVVLHEEEGFF